MRARATATTIAIAALALMVAATTILLTLSSAGWSLTALPRVDSRSGLGVAAHGIDHSFHTVHPQAYDGQFYWAIAIDPLATGRLHELVDKPSYRYGHPLYGWLGWLFSAGQADAVPAALAGIGFFALVAGAALASALGGGWGWEGLFVALNPGLISGADNDLAEPLAAALLLGVFAARSRQRSLLTWLCLAALPLAKEPLIVVIPALTGWELVHRRRRAAFLLITSALPPLAWWTFARFRLNAWFTTGDTALGTPFKGWLHAFQPTTTGVALALVFAMIAAGFIRAVRQVPNPLAVTYVALAILALCLADNATATFTTAMRNTSFLIVLLPFVLVARHRA